jgi:hypothetical protein
MPSSDFVVICGELLGDPAFEHLVISWKYAIDVCKNTDRSECDAADASAWFPFTDLQSRLGLASVTPAEKCKATTDNPKSACPGFTAPRKKNLH